MYIRTIREAKIHTQPRGGFKVETTAEITGYTRIFSLRFEKGVMKSENELLNALLVRVRSVPCLFSGKIQRPPANHWQRARLFGEQSKVGAKHLKIGIGKFAF